MYAWHKTQIINFCSPFKSQYPHTNSPNWSPYISLKNYLREFGKRSNIFLFVIILLILIDFAHDSLWILLGENWSWAVLGLKWCNVKFPLCFTGKYGTIIFWKRIFIKMIIQSNPVLWAPASIWTPPYYGQLSLSLGKALTVSLNVTHLIWTPINADNRHLFLAQSTESDRKSTSVMRTRVNCLLK